MVKHTKDYSTNTQTHSAKMSSRTRVWLGILDTAVFIGDLDQKFGCRLHEFGWQLWSHLYYP